MQIHYVESKNSEITTSKPDKTHESVNQESSEYKNNQSFKNESKESQKAKSDTPVKNQSNTQYDANGSVNQKNNPDGSMPEESSLKIAAKNSYLDSKITYSKDQATDIL